VNVAIAGLIVCLSLWAGVAGANPASTTFRSEGDKQEYNLRLDQALQRYLQAVDADPNDPASYRAVAATYMMRIAFHRGAVTADDFLGGEVNTDTLDMPKPPTDMAGAFKDNAERALRLAEAQVQAHPDSADAHYQLSATIGLLASYSATINGQVFAAFRLARRAYRESNRAMELDPSRRDAGLVVGLYQYVVSTRSLPVRWLARISGLDGDKGRGVSFIEAAARYPGENQTDAAFALVLIYNREHRYDDALRVLSTLEEQYPDNRLLWLEAGSTALRARRFQDAAQLLDHGFAKLLSNSSLIAFGEQALWHYKRGASFVGAKRKQEATVELRASLDGAARDWVRGRAHAELGKLADLAGDRVSARAEYQTAVQLARRADDSIGLADAEQFLIQPYK
jgi:tetratricopeptide (TPR) repeat protein